MKKSATFLLLLVVLLCGQLIIIVNTAATDCNTTPYSANCPNSGAPGPSQDELYSQLLVNKARMDPAGEGNRLAGITDANIVNSYKYYKVNIGQVQSAFAGYPVQQPLAWNPKLYAAAGIDARDMAKYHYQDHRTQDGTPWYTTITQQGYSGGAGQNAYTYGQSIYFTHAAFVIDWGVPSIDHRKNIMSIGYPYQEIGVSVVPSTDQANFGPIVTVQNFGNPTSAPVTAIIGVTYSDNNGDGSFTSGEGIGGSQIVIKSANTGTKYKVIAYSSGYYRADLPGNDCYQVKFNNNGFSVTTNGVCLSHGQIIQITARTSPSGGIVGTNGIHPPPCDSSGSSDSEESCDNTATAYNYNYTNDGASDISGQDATFVYPADTPPSNATINSPQTNGSNVANIPNPSPSFVSSAGAAPRMESALFEVVYCVLFYFFG